jgi:hypothetical protein
MPGGERHRFVEEEKLGPAAAAHHLPVPPLVVENVFEMARPVSVLSLESATLELVASTRTNEAIAVISV